MMGRDLRHVPPDSLVEVTNRTVEGRYFLRPSREVNEIVTGVLAKATHVHGMRVVAFFFAGNHYHGLLRPRDVQQLSAFMHDLDGQIASEINRLLGRSGPLWARRFRSIPISDEPEAQLDRLHYILANPVAANLVASPQQWPGVSSTSALLHGGPIRGVWFDRTARWYARRRGEKLGRYDYSQVYELHLSPAPCCDHLEPRERRDLAANFCRGITHHARERRRRTGKPPLGVKKILAQDPWESPETFRPTPAPRAHAHSPHIRVMMERQYRAFADTYREAADNLAAGRPYRFPDGCFPPPLPFQPNRAPPSAPAT